MVSDETWLEWKEKCAVENCAEGARLELSGFILARFRGAIFRLVPADSVGVFSPWLDHPMRCAHEFQAYLSVPRASGRRYKDNLFAAAAEGRSLEGYATDCIKSVVREMARLCLPPPVTVAPVPDGPPDFEQTELAELASQEAAKIFERMTETERWAMWAKHRGISLAAPEILEEVALAKTAFYVIANQFEEEMRRGLEDRFEIENEDDRASFWELARLVCQKLEVLLEKWHQSRKEGGADSLKI